MKLSLVQFIVFHARFLVDATLPVPLSLLQYVVVRSLLLLQYGGGGGLLLLYVVVRSFLLLQLLPSADSLLKPSL